MRMLLRGVIAFGTVIVAVVVAACGSDEENDAPIRRARTDAADGINATGVGAGTGANTGLPCDVQHLLESRCIGCHLAGTTFPLLTYEDLQKPAPSDASKTMAQKSLERMQSATSPMPPQPAEPPTAEEIQILRGWVDARTPRGESCAGSASADGGAPGGGVYNTPSVCTSNTRWTRGNDESPNMRPGGACITCHSMKGGPAYRVAGTVYPTAHEPNDCNGSAGNLTVIVTDANGVVTNIPVGSVGNFYSRARITPPFRVKVTNGVKERVMVGALTSGDCNTCHTEAGVNGAPGRVMAP